MAETGFGGALPTSIGRYPGFLTGASGNPRPPPMQPSTPHRPLTPRTAADPSLEEDPVRPTLRVHIAVLVAVLAANVLGFLLHAPFSFLDVWAGALRATPEALAEPPAVAMVLAVGGSAALFYWLAWLFDRLHVRSALEGLGIATVLAVAVLLPSTGLQYAFAEFGAAAFLVDGAHQAASVVLGGLVLGWAYAPVARRVPADPVGSTAAGRG